MTADEDHPLPFIAAVVMMLLLIIGSSAYLGHILTLQARPSLAELSQGESDNDDVLVVRSNFGGRLDTYERRWEAVKQMGLQVVIDGECGSACAMLFWIVPPARVCVTPRATFGFHMVTVGGIPSREETDAFVARLPSAVRGWIERNGPLMPDVIYMPAYELHGYFPKCYDWSDPLL